jgi:hypothetical protein
MLRSFLGEERRVTRTHDPATGRPLADGDEAIGSLSDEELELELTVAAHDPLRRHRRYERLTREWLTRNRAYRRHVRRPQLT